MTRTVTPETPALYTIDRHPIWNGAAHEVTIRAWIADAHNVAERLAWYLRLRLRREEAQSEHNYDRKIAALSALAARGVERFYPAETETNASVGIRIRWTDYGDRGWSSPSFHFSEDLARVRAAVAWIDRAEKAAAKRDANAYPWSDPDTAIRTLAGPRVAPIRVSRLFDVKADGVNLWDHGIVLSAVDALRVDPPAATEEGAAA